MKFFFTILTVAITAITYQTSWADPSSDFIDAVKYIADKSEIYTYCSHSNNRLETSHPSSSIELTSVPSSDDGYLVITFNLAPSSTFHFKVPFDPENLVINKYPARTEYHYSYSEHGEYKTIYATVPKKGYERLGTSFSVTHNEDHIYDFVSCNVNP